MLQTLIRRKKVKRYFKLNHQITAEELRVIDEEGKLIGVLKKSEALKLAEEAEADLVEIAPDAKPPVAKIVDYKKFKYLEDKKEKEARKKTKQTELKEVRITPFIGDHDLNTALVKVKKFLSSGDLVKVSVVFKGRQMAHQEFGPKLLERVMTELSGLAEIDRPSRMEGRRFVTIIKPVKGTTVNKKPEEDSKKPEIVNGKPETEADKKPTTVATVNQQSTIDNKQLTSNETKN